LRSTAGWRLLTLGARSALLVSALGFFVDLRSALADWDCRDAGDLITLDMCAERSAVPGSGASRAGTARLWGRAKALRDP
jgi:hypothetical protein